MLFVALADQVLAILSHHYSGRVDPSLLWGSVVGIAGAGFGLCLAMACGTAAIDLKSRPAAGRPGSEAGGAPPGGAERPGDPAVEVRSMERLKTTLILVATLALGCVAWVASTVIFNAEHRIPRISSSTAQYERRWEVNTVLGPADAQRVLADQRVLAALRGASAESLRRPRICFARLDITYHRSGGPKKAALLIVWVGDRPDADAVVFRVGHKRQMAPIDGWQVKANQIRSQVGVVYSAVLAVPRAILAWLPAEHSASLLPVAVATSVGGKRDSPWYLLPPTREGGPSGAAR
jgi:hypothetical protein